MPPPTKPCLCHVKKTLRKAGDDRKKPKNGKKKKVKK